MGRPLNTETLDGAARYYASAFMNADRMSPHGDRAIDGPQFVMEQFYKFTYKDEFEYLLAQTKGWLGSKAVAEFDRLAGNVFKPRDEAVLRQLLRAKLAVDMDGAHIEGAIGTVEVHGKRLVGTHMVEIETGDSIRRRKRLGLSKKHRETMIIERPLYWPIYAGENEERIADSGVADPLPPGTPGMPVGALNTRIANAAAIAACDSIVDLLDGGTGAACIEGRSGTQPADPDTTVTGTRGFTITAADPAFGSATDAAPGGQATAAGLPITDADDADATITLGYCRVSSSNNGTTPLVDYIDGEAGLSGADFNFNTLDIVSGAAISLTAWTVTMPES